MWCVFSCVGCECMGVHVCIHIRMYTLIKEQKDWERAWYLYLEIYYRLITFIKCIVCSHLSNYFGSWEGRIKRMWVAITPSPKPSHGDCRCSFQPSMVLKKAKLGQHLPSGPCMKCLWGEQWGKILSWFKHHTPMEMEFALECKQWLPCEVS